MLKQIIVEPQMISAYMQDRRRIPLTVMSFDVGVHELVVPIVGLDTALITNVLAVFKLLRVDSVIQTDGSVVDDKVHVVIPHQLNGYKGRFTIEIDLQLTNNRSLTLAQFDASARLSDIDNFGEDLKPYYFKLFDDLVVEIERQHEDAKKEIIDETNVAILEIGEQVEKVDKAKKETIEFIEGKVAPVETAKRNAIESIETEQRAALNAIESEETTALKDMEDAVAGALNEIFNKEDEVERAKNNALDNINQSSVDVDIIAQQKKNEINETTNQFNSHANEQKVNIDNATTALESDVETANSTIENINAKNTQVNTLASDFTTDVATKQSDVTSKYNAFDTGITEANQTIDDILALQPQFQAVLDETTGKEVISAPEIILARGGAQTLGERLDSEKAEVAAQLQHKVGGGNLATMGDLAQDVKEALTGGGVAVVGRDAVTNVNIVPDAVNGRTVSFVETKELNIYNEADSVVGKQIGISGEISDNVAAKLSGYMRVKPNTSYTINQTDTRQLVFFDSATESGYLSGISKTPSSGKFGFTTPSGCNYIRTSLSATGSNILISETANYTGVYHAYNTELVTVKNMQNVFGSEHIEDKAINYQKTDFIVTGKNRFDKLGSTSGYISASKGTILDHAVYNVSDFTPTEENEDFIISPRVRHFLAYDANQNPIPSTYMSTQTNDYTFNTGANIKFVRFSYFKSEHDIMQMEAGTTPTSYQRYGYEIPKLIHESESEVTLVNPLKDLVLFNLGDSIMAGDGNGGVGVGDIIASENSMVVYDWAKGGATIAWDSIDAESTDEQVRRQNIQYQAQQAISSGRVPDYILFNGITNDINGGRVVPLGEISTGYTATLDNTTYSGGLEKVIKDLRTAFPDVHIIYIRPHIMSSRNYENQVIYGNRALEICEKWSVFPVDLFKYSGLNTFLSVHHKYTGSTVSFPEGDRTHPNQLGYEKYYVPHIETAILAFV